ncbi:MAG: DUF1284 domain-containing protein, partial [Clostridia bacterium]
IDENIEECSVYNGKRCNSKSKVELFDNETLKACNLHSGDRIEWNEFVRIIENNVFKSKLFYTICNGCEWFALCKTIYEKD